MLHPDHLLDKLTSRQFAEWDAYYQLEPWGAEEDNRRAGTLVALVANLFREKGSKARAARDFFPSPRADLRQFIEQQKPEHKERVGRRVLRAIERAVGAVKG